MKSIVFMAAACAACTLAGEGVISLEAVGRKAFVRAEGGARLALVVRAADGSPVTNGTLSVVQRAQDGRRVCGCEAARCGADGRFVVPVETRLRPGQSTFKASFVPACSGAALAPTNEIKVAIGPNFADRMPVVAWGYGGSEQILSEYGFTHGTDAGIGFTGLDNKPDKEAKAFARYDAAVAAGVKIVKYATVCYPKGGAAKYQRRTRDGKRSIYPKGKAAPEVANPDMLAVARTVAEMNGRAFGDHPGLGGLLAVSEARDHSFPSFNGDHIRYREQTGRDVPELVRGRTAKGETSETRFPDGLVPEDDPVLSYYNWFWRGGDGWPDYCGAIADVYRRYAKEPTFFSFWDPAVRCPPLWCAVKSVDFLNQWCYAVPEPMNVAGPLEEMFAMAKGTPGRQVMMMTQLICYRWSVAPTNVHVKGVAPEWLVRHPKAGFPAIPPDVLTEATWSMLAKPVKGVMFHGWGCIYDTGSESYCYTNPETERRFKSIAKELVAPLGPMLKRLGREQPRVAILESGTTTLMGGGGTYGWSAPSVTFFQRARLDPRVIYEDEILRDGFGGTKVLYLARCRFLTKRIADKVNEFQRGGGIVVGDAKTPKCISPDVVVPECSFSPPLLDDVANFNANEARKKDGSDRHAATRYAKARMQRDAENLRAALAERGYAPAADSSSSEIVVYGRRYGSVPYLVAVNDHRDFGDYVGPWGRVMEKGLPYSGSVSLSDPGCAVGAVYELSRGGEVKFSRGGKGEVVVPVSYDTNDGRLFAFLPERISRVEAAAQGEVECGGTIKAAFRLFGKSGRPVPGLLPVEIRVRDASGRELDGAGWACAENGVCELMVATNLDDAEGDYEVSCRDRASGLSSVCRVRKARTR